VSDNYFIALAPRLLLGRGLTPGDRQHPVAVLGYDTWTRLFARDHNAPGQTLDVDGRAYTVVGVLRPEFGGLDDYPRDIWMPAGDGAPRREVEITVRLRRDVAAAQAEAGLSAFVSRMAPPKTQPSAVRANLRPNATANTLSVELLAVLSPVFAAFALVLLTACFNVSNVMLARAVARHREIAVRLALGAGRVRVARQLLTEGLLVAVLAGGLALGLASWLLRAGTVALFATLPPSLAALMRIAPMPMDARVFAFALAVAAAATLLFALMPALQASGAPLTDALRAQRSGTRAASRLRSALVVAQVAVSVLLVVAAVVLTRNFFGVGRVDLGFRTSGVYSVNVRGQQDRLIEPAAAALAADPRIGEVALTSGNPLFVTQTTWASPDADRAPVPVRYSFVSPEFFTAFDLPRSPRPSLPARRGAHVRARGHRQRGGGAAVLAGRRSRGADPPHLAIHDAQLRRARRLCSGHRDWHGPRRRHRADGGRNGPRPRLPARHRGRSTHPGGAHPSARGQRLPHRHGP
jgi:hypothetical protein